MKNFSYVCRARATLKGDKQVNSALPAAADASLLSCRFSFARLAVSWNLSGSIVENRYHPAPKRQRYGRNSHWFVTLLCVENPLFYCSAIRNIVSWPRPGGWPDGPKNSLHCARLFFIAEQSVGNQNGHGRRSAM